jgi:tetratricopeptide (TPR) repeat protein
MQQSPSRWDYVLEGLVTVLLAFLPFAFGGRDEIGPHPILTLVSGWSHEFFVGMAALMALVLAARQLFQRDARFVWSWAYLPIVLFLLLAVLQVVALPDRVVATLSPQTLKTKSNLLSDLPNAPSLLHSLTLTFYAQATRLDLRKLLAVATVFVVVVNVYRRSWQIKRLLLTISIIGFAVALLALRQTAFGGRMIYGIVPAAHLNSGPFLNHSHFGQFMNLSIGAMLALLLVRVGEITEGCESFGESYQLLRYAKLNGVYLLGVAIVLSAATIFFSLTRGGVVSMLIAAAATAGLYAWRRGRGSAGSVLFVLATLVLLVALYAGFGMVFERLATLRGVAEHNGARMQVLHDLAQVWRRFPLWGTGLGTHRYIFPTVDRSTVYSLATYAENEYAQLMEEAGAVGLALCLAFVAIVAGSFFRCIWHPRRPIHYAAYGLGYGLLAILIHSASDFGQHDPANACLTATFAALLIVLARHARPLTAQSKSRPAPVRRFAAGRVAIGIAAMAAVIAIFIVPLRAADTWRRARAEWAQATRVQAFLNSKGWESATDDEYPRLRQHYIQLRQSADGAVTLEPDDAVMRYWSDEFRWQEDLNAPDHKKPAGPASPSPAEVHSLVDDLNRARLACPTFAPVYALAGQLDCFVLHNAAAGQELISRAYELDHNELVACEALAQLDVVQGKWDEALITAQRALILDRPSALPTILSIYVNGGQPERAYPLVNGDLSGLQMLHDMLKGDPQHTALASKCEHEATELLLEAAKGSNVPADILAQAAEIHERQGNDALAIDCYERALARNYGQLDWRLKLADLLARSGKEEAAEQELEVCLHLRPHWEQAMARLDTLRTRRSHGPITGPGSQAELGPSGASTP